MKMNCKFINVLVFAAGAAIGSAVTWKLVKTKYEKIVQEEIESIKEAFADGFDDPNKQDDDSETADEEDPNSGYEQINWDDLEDLDEDDDSDEADFNEYARLVEQYTNFDEKGGPEDMAKDVSKEPYVISPYDFGELDGYHQIELTYYEGDDTLEDEEYNVITDRDELIGKKALQTFGEYEDDAVFVRNERLRTDFQILKDYRKYTEARSIGPNQVDDE